MVPPKLGVAGPKALHNICIRHTHMRAEEEEEAVDASKRCSRNRGHARYTRIRWMKYEYSLLMLPCNFLGTYLLVPQVLVPRPAESVKFYNKTDGMKNAWLCLSTTTYD